VERIKLGITSYPKSRHNSYKTLIYNIEYARVFAISAPAAYVLEFETEILFYYNSLGLRLGSSENILCNSIELLNSIINEIYNYACAKFGANSVQSLNHVQSLECTKENAADVAELKERVEGRKIIENKLAQLSRRALFPVKLRNYQIHAAESFKRHFVSDNKGILNWARGLGKTMTSLYILSEVLCYKNNATNMKRALIGVPSIAILEQWLDVLSKIDIFANYTKIAATSKNIDNILCTTSAEELKNYIEDSQNVIVLTTYHSSKVCIGIEFDCAIYDEIHHLCGELQEDCINNFKNILKCSTRKLICLTATMKQSYLSDNKECRTSTISDKSIISNDNIAIFGSVIDYKSVQWAINNKYITDYVLLAIETPPDTLKYILKDRIKDAANASLFLSAFSVLYGFANAINNMSHTFIYTNSKSDSELTLKYIKELLLCGIFPIDSADIYFCSINSDSVDISGNISSFRASRYAIIVCVYMLGEGFDDPIIDSLCIGQQMVSKIRSIQSLLRGNRRNLTSPDKINTIIFPNIDIESVYCETMGQLLENMRNEDRNIEEKIKCIRIKRCSEQKQPADVANFNSGLVHDEISERLCFRVFDVRRMNKTDLFNRYSAYNRKFAFRRISDYEYAALDPKYHLYYIRRPTEYFIEVWNAAGGWYAFLGIDTSLFPSTKDAWREKCIELSIKSDAEYLQVCEKNNMPIDYAIYYRLNIEDIPWTKILYFNY
jgi:superfamily II DNA or RNA helicase